MMLAAASIVAAGASFTCTPMRVWDGGGPIWCAEGPKIRLARVAAREIDRACRPHHPCPKAAGTAARDALVKLIGAPAGTSAEGHVLIRGKPLTCRSEGSGKGFRTAAWCSTAAGRNLSCAMVQGGYALRWPQYDRDRRMCR
jgi:endonuclease YncB( thermonuclease family)